LKDCPPFLAYPVYILNTVFSGRARYVRIGVTDLEDTNHRQQLEVEELIPYPEYKSSSHYHDIGLLRLKRSAKLDSFTVPACLYRKHDIEAEKAIATGWGHTTWGGSGSNNLLKVTLDLFDHASCNRSYKNQISRRLKDGIIDDIQVCAGSLDDEKDTCQVSLHLSDECGVVFSESICT
jgi:secreted trypsin-like serine protease